MYSPSVELNAYILDYKAQKSLKNSPFSTPTRNLYNVDSLSSSKSWLQDVLTMPPEYKNRSRSTTPCSPPTQVVPNGSGDSSVAQWLNEIDDKISKRFPKVSSPHSYISHTADNDDNESIGSDKTLELILADPQTGLLNSCHCASYDSHPNASNNIIQSPDGKKGEAYYCDCSDLRAPAWVDDVINEKDVCSSCSEVDLTSYRPESKEHSVNLPNGFKLFESKTKTKPEKPLKRSKGKKKRSPQVADEKHFLNETSNSQRVSPETENVMKLLERAIHQLQEVKGAVEDNTVSAITSDISITSQALSELPVD